MTTRVLKVHPKDNLIVALQDLKAGEVIGLNGQKFKLKTSVPAKHKFLQVDVKSGDDLMMYGVLIGKAKKSIARGEVATVGNVEHATQQFTLGKKDLSWKKPNVRKFIHSTFKGYHRSDGKVGTANYWLVMPLVFCENRNIEMVRDALVEELGYSTGKDYTLDVRKLVTEYQNGSAADHLVKEELIVPADQQKQRQLFPNVDGVKFLTHDGGCGGTRQDSDTLCALLAGYLNNPNVAGGTVLSLGCQNAQVKILEKAIKKINPKFDKPLYILGQQESNSEPEFIADAVKQTFIGLIEANKFQRKASPLSNLVVGLECGGSDGFSGISANPAVGHFSDLLVSLGGSVILSEFPELNGVEQELTDRCSSMDLARKFTELMDTYHNRAKESGSGFDANPSPGNIKDGLITDAMKSAGAAKKGGTSPIVDVLDYTEQVTKPGLNLLCTPGNDVESTTGLAGSGATLTLFTTGLGTPTGNPISPVIKISSNNKLTERMYDIIDINAGTIITGEDTIESKGQEILEYVIAVASGEKAPHSVRLAQDDFIPWKRGISL
ncbi:MAG: altronate dehydratase family protein [Bacteroidota bacterium]